MKTAKALRFLSNLRALALGVVGAAAMLAAPTAQAKVVNNVGYSVPRQVVQGNMPFSTSYTLQITSPSYFPAGTTSQITLVTSVITAPSGVSNATALSFVTYTPLQTGLTGLLGGILSPIVSNLTNLITSSSPTLTFTGPNQTLSVTVTCNFPLGNWAGSFGYEIQTSGWPTTLDPNTGLATPVIDQGAFINVTAAVPMATNGLPVVSISQPVDQTVYTWYAGGGDLMIPYTLVGNTQDGSPLIAFNGSISANGGTATDLGITPVGLGTANATATGNLDISGPGVYTIMTNDANANGTATASVQITVQAAAGPPSVVINTPADGSSYVMTGNLLSLPFGFTGTSQYGGVVTLTATLDGTPINFTPNGYGNLVATGNSTLNITTTGTHTIVVTCMDNYGTATTSANFDVTVQAATPPPTVVINTPAPNATYTYTTGGPNLVVPFTFTGSCQGGNVTGLTATMDGNPVTFTPTGLGTGTANGTASLSFNGASVGNHTLAVTASNAVGTAQASEVITVVVQNPTTSTLKVAITGPAANSTYTMPTSGCPLSIPDSFTSNSTAASGVTSLKVSFNGTPVNVSTSTLGKPTVTANGTLVVSAPGVYSLSVTATDQNGPATTSENITVNAPAANPQISIVKPVDGSQYTVGTSACPLWVSVSVTGNTTPGYTLNTFTLTLNGQPVTYNTLAGLNTVTANGTVSLQITATGTYTLVATDTSNGLSATDTATFTVVAPSSCGGGEDGGWGNGFGGWNSGGNNNNGGFGGFGGGNNNNGGFGGFGGGSYGGGNNNNCTPTPCTVNWQQSWSCNTTQKGGSSLPLCFQVQYSGSNCTTYWNSYFNNCGSDYYNEDSGSRSCWNLYGYFSCFLGSVPSSQNCLNNNWDNISGSKCSHDNTVQVVCYETFSNGSCGTPKVYSCTSRSNTCSLSRNDQYSCNFATTKGTHNYRCDVYYTNTSTGKQCFLGTQQFCTR